MPINLLTILRQYYTGFKLAGARGNNAFSYDQRDNKEIYVPSVLQGTPADLKPGREVVFCEMEDGVEHSCRGLEQFVYFDNGRQKVFFFDNHNHAFFFWLIAWSAGLMPAGTDLLHIDQHRDMRIPDRSPDFSLTPPHNLDRIFRYSQDDLNVGNFIQPALALGLFSGVTIVDSSMTFAEPAPPARVLDIDLDIFAPEMDYIDNDLKVERIRRYLQQAEIVTVATSPYFVDQQLAISFARRLFAEKLPE